MAKHTDKVGSFDDFKAPWETESGEDAEIDKSKLKRLIYNLKHGEAKALDSRDEALETVKTVEVERDEAKAEVAKASPEEAGKKITKLEDENKALKGQVDSLTKAAEVADLRTEVLEGVPAKIAKHVKGETREEIEESLKGLAEDFGFSLDGEGDESDEPKIRTGVADLINPVTGKPVGGSDKAVDFDAAADGILSGGRVFG